MIQIDDIIEIYGKQYKCWFTEDLSGNNFSNAAFDADKIYIHLISESNTNDGICVLYSDLITQASYIDWLVENQRKSMGVQI
jgi:hypothetical protein